jgi:hypothetical protein
VRDPSVVSSGYRVQHATLSTWRRQDGDSISQDGPRFGLPFAATPKDQTNVDKSVSFKRQ